MKTQVHKQMIFKGYLLNPVVSENTGMSVSPLIFNMTFIQPGHIQTDFPLQ